MKNYDKVFNSTIAEVTKPSRQLKKNKRRLARVAGKTPTIRVVSQSHPSSKGKDLWVIADRRPGYIGKAKRTNRKIKRR